MTAAREHTETRGAGLNASQAGGHECVMCETSFVWPEVPAQHRPNPVPGTRSGPAGIPAVPVGVSGTGSQVFACLGICAALAYPD
ncbi:hypothetical protein [Actinomycetospora cinnamomea]|uniref:Uncharacterized protein n=1 Tax=Actinomycetospora cinnamomea TaxID=663609 RepID=A0A2U1FA23_9PSEU|nr:hypothetical protein [Actinomycetospora cinnamomea]PVZ09043.1 hypothetical protein C8D89_107206 [Actinomycetospora cinnamomea]